MAVCPRILRLLRHRLLLQQERTAQTAAITVRLLDLLHDLLHPADRLKGGLAKTETFVGIPEGRLRPQQRRSSSTLRASISVGAGTWFSPRAR